MLRGLKTFQHIFFIDFPENYLSSGVPDNISTIIFMLSGKTLALTKSGNIAIFTPATTVATQNIAIFTSATTVATQNIAIFTFLHPLLLVS